MRVRFLAVVTVLVSALGIAAPAFAATIFSDGTFNLGNYSGPTFDSASSQGGITYLQCGACGDPGNALQFTSTSNTTETGTLTLAQALVNSGFSYDPLTHGAITSLSTSVLKNISINITGSGFGNTYYPTIEQGGVFYVASIPGGDHQRARRTGVFDIFRRPDRRQFRQLRLHHWHHGIAQS